MIEYRWGKTGELRKIRDFADHCFQPSRFPSAKKAADAESFFGTFLPKIFNHEETAPCHAVAVEEEELRGVVGLYPEPMTVFGEPFLVYGIGQVCTDPAHRGEGHMRALMQMAIDRAKSEGGDLIFLDGLRHRYRYYGFEQIRGTAYTFTATNARHLFGPDAGFSYTFRELTVNDSAGLQAVRAMMAMDPVTGENAFFDGADPDSVLFERLCSMGHRPWLIMKENAPSGCFLWNAREAALADLRLREPSEILKVLNDLLKTDLFFQEKQNAEKGPAFRRKLTLEKIPAYETEMTEKLLLQAEEAAVGPNGQILILNAAHTLEAGLRIAASYRGLSDGTCILRFENGETVRITVKGGKPVVESLSAAEEGGPKERNSAETAQGAPVFSMAEAAGLFFGMPGLLPGKISGLSEEARSWFPLELVWRMADEV